MTLDAALRALERAAALGDPEARARLIGESLRAGRPLVAATFGSKWLLLCAKTGRTLATSTAKKGPLTALAISSDGSRAITGGRDRVVRVWDLALGVEQRELHGHRQLVTDVAFSPDGAVAASASLDQTVRLWHLASGEPLVVLQRHAELWSVGFSGSGERVIAAGADGTVKIWDAAPPGRVVRSWRSHATTVASAALSPDGALAASGSWDHSIAIMDVASGRVARRLEGHAAAVQSVAFTSDGARLVSCGRDATVRVWDVASGALERTIEDDQRWLLSLAISRDGRTIAAGGDARVKLWDLATGERVLTIPMKLPKARVAFLAS